MSRPDTFAMVLYTELRVRGGGSEGAPYLMMSFSDWRMVSTPQLKRTLILWKSFRTTRLTVAVLVREGELPGLSDART